VLLPFLVPSPPFLKARSFPFFHFCFALKIRTPFFLIDFSGFHVRLSFLHGIRSHVTYFHRRYSCLIVQSPISSPHHFPLGGDPISGEYLSPEKPLKLFSFSLAPSPLLFSSRCPPIDSPSPETLSAPCRRPHPDGPPPVHFPNLPPSLFRCPSLPFLACMTMLEGKAFRRFKDNPFLHFTLNSSLLLSCPSPSPLLMRIP